MANRKVQIDILADAKNFNKGMGEAEKATNKLHSALDRFGPVGSGIANLLGKLGFSSVGAAVGVGAVATALGVGIKIVEDSIAKYAELGEKIRNYSLITGQSAEASSRQVEAFQILGVNEEVAAAGMFRLGREAATAQAKLAKVGIEVATNSDGTVDLSRTLLNVVKAYQATGDAAQKDLIVFTAFGRAGASMIPILETNAAQLENIEKNIAKVYTQADLDKVREYKIQQRELKEAQDELALNLGQALLPAQLASIEAANRSIYVQKHLGEAQDAASHSASGQLGNTRNLARSLGEEYDAAQAAKRQADELASAQQAAADAAKAQADAENALFAALHKDIDAGFAYEQALLDLAAAQKAARDAGGKDAEANLRLREAYVKVADAAVAKAEADAEAAGSSLDAGQKADIFRQALEAQIKTLAPNSPLRKELEGYIKQLESVPHHVDTQFNFRGINSATGGQAHGNLSFDKGGIVPGPTGAPVPAIVHGGEEVIPVGGHRDGGTHIHLHIGTLIGADGPGMDRLAREILQRARFAPGT